MMMKKIFNFVYFLFLLLGVVAGLYGICYENLILKWIGAVLVIAMPTVTFLIEWFIDK